MRRLAPSRWAVLAFTLLLAAIPSCLHAVDATPLRAEPASASNIVIGFVGGFVRHDNPYHGPVRLAQSIRKEVTPETYVGVFENRRRRQAYETVMRLLDSDRDGQLSDAEKARARIVIYGHSWGAAAAVQLARDLQRIGVPVLLTAQVDSVAKLWQNDSLIPANVAEAVNFYQTHGIVHGRARIKASDPAKTAILGNYLLDYRKAPVRCEGTSWADRLFTPDHIESECDGHVWSQIEKLVRELLAPSSTSAVVTTATNPQP